MNSKPKRTNDSKYSFQISVFPRPSDQKAWFSVNKSGRCSCESSGSEREASATASEFLQALYYIIPKENWLLELELPHLSYFISGDKRTRDLSQAIMRTEELPGCL